MNVAIHLSTRRGIELAAIAQIEKGEGIMKLSTNQVSETEVETKWDSEGKCVTTTLSLKAIVMGEANAQAAATLKEAGEVWLTLSSAPVRAVSKDAKKPAGTGKRAYRKREAKETKPQSQGVDSNAALPAPTGKTISAAEIVATAKAIDKVNEMPPELKKPKKQDGPIFDLRKEAK